MISSRLKREDCQRTKHDSAFSAWKVLVGPSDWEDHSLGKEGVERYRTHNLPANCPCPGLYELGIPATPTDKDHKTRKHALNDIIVVYLGQADNVRTRLQEYGRAGSHLDHGNLSTCANKSASSCLHGGPGLFREIFARGYPIMYRWTPMANKKDAENTEAELLKVFDYAWNRRGNGACRREEILAKLGNATTSPTSAIARKIQQWKQPAFGKKAGIRINSSLPLDEAGSSYTLRSLLPEVVKFVGVRIRLVPAGDRLHGKDNFCGVATGGGSICKNRPVEGRKRCEVHKGKRITGIGYVKNELDTANKGNMTVCGVVLEHGSVCLEFPAHGRKRCEMHKGRRIVEPARIVRQSDFKLLTPFSMTESPVVQGKYDLDQKYGFCGVKFGDGSVCRNSPVPGRIRCEQHKGQRVTETKLSTSTGDCGGNEGRRIVEPARIVRQSDFKLLTPFSMTESRVVQGKYDLDQEYIFCGVKFGDGSVCRNNPVPGMKRCEQHKGQRITETKLSTSTGDWGENEKYYLDEQDSICGAATHDGYACMRKPAFGLKRCEQHKGQRIAGRKERYDLDDQDSICGAATAYGYACRRKPVPGRKRCEEHKGKWAMETGSMEFIDSSRSIERSAVCGATLRNGSTCMKMPVPGRKRCAQHKGQRVT